MDKELEALLNKAVAAQLELEQYISSYSATPNGLWDDIANRSNLRWKAAAAYQKFIEQYVETMDVVARKARRIFEDRLAKGGKQ